MKKKSKIIWKKLIFYTFLLSCFAGLFYALLSSQYLKVGNVVIEGNTTLTKEQVCRAAGITPPVNIFNLHTDYIQARLEKDVRIKSVMVKRVFPMTLFIKIEQRQALATIHCGYGYANIDKEGLIISVNKNLQATKIPLVTGRIFQDAYIGDKVNDATLKVALAYLCALSEKDLQIISEINISNNQQLVAYTSGGVQIRLGALQNPKKSAEQTQEFLQNLKQIKRPIEYVDFGYDSPVLKFK